MTTDSSRVSLPSLVERWPFELVVGQGADRTAFLHRLLSGPVAAVPHGSGCHTLLLDTKGHVQSDMQLYVAGETVRLVVPAGQGAATAAALSRYAIMDDFTAAWAADQFGFAVVGPGAAGVLAQAGLAVPPAIAEGARFAHGTSQEGRVWFAKQRGLGEEILEVWTDLPHRTALLEALAQAGVATLAPEVAEALRIAAGEPRFGVDVTPDRFPMELGLDDAIDYAKGCYLGQEPIVRIRDRGHVNWGLRRLRLPADAPVPAAGDKLESDARPAAGHITSAARLPSGTVVALALLHKSVGDGPVRALTAEGPVAAQVLPLAPSSALDRGGLD